VIPTHASGSSRLMSETNLSEQQHLLCGPALNVRLMPMLVGNNKHLSGSRTSDH